MLDTAKAHVIEALLVSPVAKEAEARHAKATAARRAALAQERAAIERVSGERFEAHYKAQAAAFEKCQTAELALMAAKAELGALIASRAAECYALDMAGAAAEAELRETADPAIARFIVEMRDDLERVLRVQPALETTAVRNVNTGQVAHLPTARRVKPAERATAIRQAIAQAEALKLEPDQGGVAAKLAALRDSLPVIGAELKGAAQ
jgi:hypothetical protein